MPRRTVSCRLRLCLRVAALAGVAVSIANCSDSARFSSESYVSDNQRAPIQNTAPISPRPAYRSVERQSLPPPTQETAPNTSQFYAPARANDARTVGHYQAPPAKEVVTARWAKSEIYIVKRGETLPNIAHRHGLSVVALAHANNMTARTRIKAGDRILIPSDSRTKVASQPSNVESVQSRRAGAHVSSPEQKMASTPMALTPEQKIASTSQQKMASASTPQNIRVAIQEPKRIENNAVKNVEPSGAMPSFRWPVHGRIISAFGSRSTGTRNDGINVAVPEGTPVKAAEDGVVAYAGNEQGYGNLLLVRHANGYVSVYANASELLVKRGDTIKRGQVIAHAGQTGSVSSPQLHFEIRKGSTPVDPNKFLGGA